MSLPADVVPIRPEDPRMPIGVVDHLQHLAEDHERQVAERNLLQRFGGAIVHVVITGLEAVADQKYASYEDARGALKAQGYTYSEPHPGQVRSEQTFMHRLFWEDVRTGLWAGVHNPMARFLAAVNGALGSTHAPVTRTEPEAIPDQSNVVDIFSGQPRSSSASNRIARKVPSSLRPEDRG